MVEKIFDRECLAWKNNAQYCIRFITRNIVFANDKLRIRGWISLNDVYDLLGLPRELEAQIIGWKFTGEKNHECIEFETIEEQNSSIRIIFKNTVKLL